MPGNGINNSARLLIVDDEEFNRSLLRRRLERQGYGVDEAASGAEALACLSPAHDLVLLDVCMPGMDGFETARNIRCHPHLGDVPILMATALDSRADRLCAMEAGANDYITKPIDATELRIRVAALLKTRSATDALKRHQEILEHEIQAATGHLIAMIEQLTLAHEETQNAHFDTLHRLALAAECRDHHTAAHIRRVGQYAALLALRVGLLPAECEQVYAAATLHDVGKLGIPDTILLKPGRLTDDERHVMEQHTVQGARILHGSTAPLLQYAETIALTHHEKWDGSGYPHGLGYDAIPLPGRITAIADVYDALTTDRPYKPAYPHEQAVAMLRDGRGSHFDPTLLDAFLVHPEELLAIAAQHPDETLHSVAPLDFARQSHLASA